MEEADQLLLAKTTMTSQMIAPLQNNSFEIIFGVPIIKSHTIRRRIALNFMAKSKFSIVMTDLRINKGDKPISQTRRDHQINQP